MNFAPKHTQRGKAFTFAALLLIPSMLIAHPGHGEIHSFGSGVAHFFSGWDHILTAALAGLLLASKHQLGGWASILGALMLPVLMTSLLHGSSSGMLWTASLGLWIAGACTLATALLAHRTGFASMMDTAYLRRTSIGFALLGLALIQL